MLHECAIPLMQAAVALGDSALHPVASRLGDLAFNVLLPLGLLRRNKEMDPYCAYCFGFPYCNASYCSGPNCTGTCRPNYGACPSGGTCWTIRGSSWHCCDCYCCTPIGGGCGYCICAG